MGTHARTLIRPASMAQLNVCPQTTVNGELFISRMNDNASCDSLGRDLIGQQKKDR